MTRAESSLEKAVIPDLIRDPPAFESHAPADERQTPDQVRGDAGSKAVAFSRIFLMAVWLAICVTAHLLHRAFGRSPWPRRLLGGIGHIAGARVRTLGTPPAGGTLIVANHVSWLDIPMLAGACNAAFVAKLGLKGHPIMRWLCEQNGTVFVDRDRRQTIEQQLGEMRAALGTHKPLCLFPEGTVSQDGKPLPFRPALLKIAEEPGVTAQPVAIDYGAHAREFAWPPGEGGKANFLRLLGRRGTVAVTIHFLEPLAAGEDRKAVARTSQQAIERALGLG